MATCDFGPVTVISCERALFFIYIWIISWDATNRYSIKTIVKLHCHVDRWATDFRYVIQKFWGVRLFGEARVFGRILYIYIYIYIQEFGSLVSEEKFYEWSYIYLVYSNCIGQYLPHNAGVTTT